VAELTLYVGTYSRRGSEGIYGLRFDAQTGALTRLGALAGLHNPSFLALHPNGRIVYSVCEDEQAGSVAAIALHGESDASPVLNGQSTRGDSPCHLAVDPTGRWLVTANYSSGSVVLHPIREDGSLEPSSDLVQHSGHGPRADRQASPHCHSVTFDPSGRFIIVADLGIDRLMLYTIDPQRGKLVPHRSVGVAPGAGPRHFAFHPSGDHGYLINELGNTVVGYHWDAETGVLDPLQTLSTLPADFTGESYCADLHVHPAGTFLYGTNRGHDSLAIFRVDPKIGLLEATGHVSTEGQHPRNFALTADGCWLLVANQDTDNIVIFRVSPDGGQLELTSELTGIPAPVCLLFAERPAD
jgi:6-phosphogluconolactonase